MDLLLKNIEGVCVVKMPMDGDKISSVDISECVEKPGRIIIFPIRGSECFYGYDKVKKWFELFKPVSGDAFTFDILDVIENGNSLEFDSVFSAEPFFTRDCGYYYAYMRLANPDSDREAIIDIVRNIENVNPSSFKKFTNDLNRGSESLNVNKLPPEIRSKILLHLTFEKLKSLNLPNYVYWEIYRQRKSRKWDPDVNWVDFILPADYLHVPEWNGKNASSRNPRRILMIGSVSDLLSDPADANWILQYDSTFKLAGMYRFKNFRRGGVWLRNPEQNVENLIPFELYVNEREAGFEGFGNDTGGIPKDGSSSSKNIERILKDANKLLGHKPPGNSKDVLSNDLFYPLIFYLTEVPLDANIIIEDPEDAGELVIWYAISGETGKPVGRVVGSKTALNKMGESGRGQSVGIRTLLSESSSEIAGFGNWDDSYLFPDDEPSDDSDDDKFYDTDEPSDDSDGPADEFYEPDVDFVSAFDKLNV